MPEHHHRSPIWTSGTRAGTISTCTTASRPTTTFTSRRTMLTTPRRGIQYPDPTTKTDRADIAQHITNCAVLLDVDVLYQEETDAARIAATHQGGGGLFWFATDTAQL